MLTTEADVGPIESDRLLLRRLREGDAADIVRLVTDEEVAKQTLSLPTSYTVDNALEWIHSETKRRLILAIEEKRTEQFLGAISLHVRGLSRWKVGTLGYWLGRPYWARGYGNEAVGLFLPYCQATYGLSRFEAKVFASNEASARVLSKNGFRKFRSKRSFLPERGGWRKIDTFRLRIR